MAPLLAGCFLTHQSVYSGAPPWVEKGGAAFRDGGKAFYGVGMSGDLASDELRRLTAETNARADVGRSLDDFIGALVRLYNEGARAEGATDSGTEVTNALKSLTSAQLTGARIIDHWLSANGTEFALARLDLDEVENELGGLKGISSQAREALRQRAEKAHQMLNEELQRRQATAATGTSD